MFILALVIILIVFLSGWLAFKYNHNRCTEASPCKLGYSCIDNKCVAKSDIKCPTLPCTAGYHCVNGATCAPDLVCNTTTCPAPKICVGGVCQEAAKSTIAVVQSKASALATALTQKNIGFNSFDTKFKAILPKLADYGSLINVSSFAKLPASTLHDTTDLNFSIDGVSISIKTPDIAYSATVTDLFTKYHLIATPVESICSDFNKYLVTLSQMSATTKISTIQTLHDNLHASITNVALATVHDALKDLGKYLTTNSTLLQHQICLNKQTPITTRGKFEDYKLCIATPPLDTKLSENLLAIINPLISNFNLSTTSDFAVISELSDELLRISKTVLK
jgi:hypothetical protein